MSRIKDMEKAIKEFRSKRLDTMRSHTAEYISALTGYPPLTEADMEDVDTPLSVLKEQFGKKD